jgi:glycosyltransferase involved in cell wall biosynthesis
MACGTPVLATSVGGVPDLIKDGNIGFIMADNSPECIARNVIRALEHPELEKIVKNARKFIKDEYSYEVMVRKCRDSLNKLMRGKR